MNDIAIRVENLSKAYKLYQKPVDRLKEALHPLKKKYHKDFYALKDLSFEIKKGETVGIVGKNGSGKSTLLKLITGVTTPSGGKITVNGRISAILELGAGFNPQMTGLENIYLNTSINGMSRQETDSKVAEIIAFAELGEFIHQPVKTYSSGMKARLAFAVSISVEPDILIVDEALSVGDAAFQRKCFAKMEDIRAKGATILFVSHSEASVVALCNRAIWISNGQQIIDGAPKLVTGLYMKNIKKAKVHKVEIEQEYAILVKGDKADKSIEPEALQPAIRKSQQAVIEQTAVITEYYDPALKSKSTIYYEEKGARISNVGITTLEGKKVNVLRQGKDYLFTYSVRLDEDVETIQFGMGFKEIKGTIVAGSIYPAINNYIKLRKGVYEARFKFKCKLNKETFTTNCGVLSPEKDSVFKHRVVDGLLFKVVDDCGDDTKTGFVDLDIKFQKQVLFDDGF